MRCPHCGTQFVQGRCPACRQSMEESRLPALEQPSRPRRRASPASLSGARQATALDWREEVQRRLDKHYKKRKGRPRKESVKPKDAEIHSPAQRPERVLPLFDHVPLEVSSRPKPRVVAFTSVKAPLVSERPVIRPPVGPVARASRPHQRQLSLEPPRPASHAPAVSLPAPPPEGVSYEILFSRLLCGMIDLSLPVGLALLFNLTAALLVSLDFFSPTSFRLGAILALSFYLSHTLFFLLLSGQTPGMVLTELKLVGEDGRECTPRSVLLRVILFLPTAATLLGLLWALFDPWCRCWHDRASGTRIIPGAI